MLTLGPGTFKIGSAGAEVDYSIKVNNMRLTTTADTTDPTTKLSGDQFPGVTTFTGELGGNVDIDPETADGLFQLSSEHGGTVQAFTYTPNDVAAIEARGLITIMPLDLGADEYGADLTSDLAWATVGDIEFYRDGVLAWTQYMGKRAATLPPPAKPVGATAGTPGTFTPLGVTPPASVAALQSASPAIVASPAAVWTVGQYVQTATAGVAGQASWDGAAWIAGPAIDPGAGA